MSFDYIDYILLAFGILHILYEFFSNKGMQKKIVNLCTKCFSPVYSDERHDCNEVSLLSSSQLEALVAFVNTLK